MEASKIGIETFLARGAGAVLTTVLPLALAIVWVVKKKEKFTTVLVGALVFVVIALFLEKLIQNVLIFPEQMGLSENAVSRYVNARPLLWAFLVALFPGVFEETGRLLAFQTLLKKRKNRETSVSYGIGHGGMEVILLVGVTFAIYIVYGLMIDSGAFQGIIDQVAATAPAQAESYRALPEQIAALGFADVGLAVLERVFAVLFHIGASILVFYACRDRGKGWLYPLAILLHTAMDFSTAAVAAKLADLSVAAQEGIIAIFGLLTFLGAYFLLYKKDRENEANSLS